MKNVENRKEDIKLEINNKQIEINECYKNLDEVEKTLKKYNESVSVGRKLSIFSGFLATILLNCIVQYIFCTKAGFFSVKCVLTPSYLLASTVAMIPTFAGLIYSYRIPKKMEKEMGIKKIRLEVDIDLNKWMINNNKKEIEKLNIKLSELDYILDNTNNNDFSPESNKEKTKSKNLTK